MMTYVDTRVDQFVGTGVSGNLIDFSDKEFNFAPPWSGTFDAEYRASLSTNLDCYVGANALYNARTFADLGENPDTRLPAYTVVDLRAGVESRAGWRVGVFVRNVGDEYYWTSVFNGGDTLVKLAGLPRTYGLTAGWRF